MDIYKRLSDIYIYIYMKRERKRRYCRSLIEISPSFVLDFLFEKSIVCLNLNKVKVSKILQIKLILVLFFSRKDDDYLNKRDLCVFFFLSFDVTGKKKKKKKKKKKRGQTDTMNERTGS